MGVIDLAQLLPSVKLVTEPLAFDVAPEGERNATATLLTTAYRQAIDAFLAKSQVDDFQRLCQKYLPIMEAARTWDFSQFPLITKGNGADEEVERETGRLDSIIMRSADNGRVCESLSRLLGSVNEEDRARVDTLLKDRRWKKRGSTRRAEPEPESPISLKG